MDLLNFAEDPETSKDDGDEDESGIQDTDVSNRIIEYIDEGDPIYTCQFCGAMMWSNERLKTKKNQVCRSSLYAA